MWLKLATKRLYNKFAQISQLSRAYWINPSGQIIPVEEHVLWIVANLNNLKSIYPDLEEFDQNVKEYEQKDADLRLSEEYSVEKMKELYNQKYASGYVEFLLEKGWIRILVAPKGIVAELMGSFFDKRISNFLEDISMKLRIPIEQLSDRYELSIYNENRLREFRITDFVSSV